MTYEGAIKIDKRDPKGDIMDVGFVVSYAFDKKGMSIEPTGRENKKNLILEAIEEENVSSAFVEMRKLKPKVSEGTYLYNEETNIKDKHGNNRYRHVVQLSGKQLRQVYNKGQDAVLQKEDKNGITFLMLGCKCKVGEVSDARDAQKLKEWKKNGAIPGEKPKVRIAGLYPRFNAEHTFGKTDERLAEDTLENLNKHEKKFWAKVRKMQKEKLVKELEDSLTPQLSAENEMELGK